MKRIVLLFFLCVLLLFSIPGSLTATSPQPEEVKPRQTVTVCATQIVSVTDPERGIHTEESPATLTFDASLSQKDVFERVSRQIRDRLEQGNVSAFRIECTFPK